MAQKPKHLYAVREIYAAPRAVSVLEHAHKDWSIGHKASKEEGPWE